MQGKAFDAYKENGHIVRNVLRLVENMKGERGEIGARVDMYEHSLQTATRARRAGADTETIVCALLHDIGEVLSGTNHGEIAAALLRPYITPMNHWLLANHEVFQAFYFLDKCGGDKDLRDKVKEYKAAGIVKGHAWYDATEKFCLKYDQPSFDPTYDTDPLASFVPSGDGGLRPQALLVGARGQEGGGPRLQGAPCLQATRSTRARRRRRLRASRARP